MRLLLAASDPLDVERGSGTAMAVARLRRALQAVDVSVPIVAPARRARAAALQRWRFNRCALAGKGCDAVLGVGGDGWRIARSLDVPYVALPKAMYSLAVLWERGPARLSLRIHAAWERRGVQQADLVVAPSQHTAEALVCDYGCDPARIRVIPEPFDGDAWAEALPRRERRGNRVLCVAHLYPRKRVGDLLDAWPIVRRSRPDARLDIVGAGPDLRRVSRRPLGERSVFLHGHVGHPEVLELFARADCFALPSAQETFGYAVVEALASGLPCVVADAGALPEIVAGAVAEIHPVGDVRALAAAIVGSLSDDVRARASTQNRKRAGAFDSRAVAAELVEAVRELSRLPA